MIKSRIKKSGLYVYISFMTTYICIHSFMYILYPLILANAILFLDVRSSINYTVWLDPTLPSVVGMGFLSL